MFNKSNQNAAPETVKSYLSIEGATVQACHLISDRICVFTLNVTGATFLNLKVVDGKNGEFIAMPQSKGRDGQYYDLYRVYLSEKDAQRVISAVEAHATAQGKKADYKSRFEV
jgi:DNA-binding cell septation regulator SpoVG